jgi:hypothetical protein
MERGKFIVLSVFSSRLEAEMAGEILAKVEIPFLIQSDDIGLFGPGAIPAPSGATLLVRKEDLLEAKALLPKPL